MTYIKIVFILLALKKHGIFTDWSDLLLVKYLEHRECSNLMSYNCTMKFWRGYTVSWKFLHGDNFSIFHKILMKVSHVWKLNPYDFMKEMGEVSWKLPPMWKVLPTFSRNYSPKRKKTLLQYWFDLKFPFVFLHRSPDSVCGAFTRDHLYGGRQRDICLRNFRGWRPGKMAEGRCGTGAIWRGQGRSQGQSS